MYNFEGDNDVVEYIKIAQEVGLVVILRPGPFIDAERDFVRMFLRNSKEVYFEIIFSGWIPILVVP